MISRHSRPLLYPSPGVRVQINDQHHVIRRKTYGAPRREAKNPLRRFLGQRDIGEHPELKLKGTSKSQALSSDNSKTIQH
jgi:hypothetical protein